MEACACFLRRREPAVAGGPCAGPRPPRKASWPQPRRRSATKPAPGTSSSSGTDCISLRTSEEMGDRSAGDGGEGVARSVGKSRVPGRAGAKARKKARSEPGSTRARGGKGDEMLTRTSDDRRTIDRHQLTYEDAAERLPLAGAKLCARSTAALIASCTVPASAREAGVRSGGAFRGGPDADRQPLPGGISSVVTEGRTGGGHGVRCARHHRSDSTLGMHRHPSSLEEAGRDWRGENSVNAVGGGEKPRGSFWRDCRQWENEPRAEEHARRTRRRLAHTSAYLIFSMTPR